MGIDCWRYIFIEQKSKEYGTLELQSNEERN
jgi:hypothetical protein